MPKALTQTAFAPHRETVFVAKVDETETVELELVEVTDKTPPDFPGEQFSLIFNGPADRPLTQRIYPLDHPAMGALDLFLVPVGRRDSVMLYEAFFNLLKRAGE